jgi:tetratricopeptide (TPR) repeat protein
MRPFGLAFIATLLVAGCATVRPSEVTRPSAQPAVGQAADPAAGQEAGPATSGSAVTVGGEDLSSYIRKVQALSSKARLARTEPETLEQVSPGLAAALALASATPTPRNLDLAGDAYRNANILDQAYGKYAEASRLDPSNAAAWDGMARIWRDWGFPALALPDAWRAVYHAPDSPASHNTLGTVFYALGRTHEARAEFERALALDAGASYALNNLCYSWVTEGDSARAVGTCSQALALAPDLRPARNNLALAYAEQGDIEGARRQFAALGSPAARDFNMGIVHMAEGDFDAAAAAFARAAALEPGLPLLAERARQARQLAAGTPGTGGDDGRR